VSNPIFFGQNWISVAAGSSLLIGLAGYWKLNEASGARADSSGTGNTLTEVGGTISSTTGKIGDCPDTIATAKWLERATNTSLQMGDVDFTIAGWFYMTALTPSRDLFRLDNGSVFDYDIYYHLGTGQFRFYFDKSAGGSVDLGTAITPNLNTWYFVVATHDSVNDLASIYWNGVLKGQLPVSGGTTITGGATFKVSSDTGRVDECGLWKRVLSASEITTLYNGGAGITYPFDGGAPPWATTRNRRAMPIGIDGIYRIVLPVPDGSVAGADRAQLVGKYSRV
jgi:Concanavalin A-like lectin/glucanases superfamily